MTPGSDDSISPLDVAHRRSLGGATASLGPSCVCVSVVGGLCVCVCVCGIGSSHTYSWRKPNFTSAIAKLNVRYPHLMSATAKLYFGCGHPLLSLSLQGLKVCLEVASATSGAGFRIARLSRDRLCGKLFFDRPLVA